MSAEGHLHFYKKELIVDNKPRRPWLAALLTLIFSTGLGHMYSGRVPKGIILFAVGQLLSLASAIAMTVIAPTLPLLLFIVFINIAFLVFRNTERRIPPEQHS